MSPHPFFEVSAYPWHRKDAIAAHRALYVAIPDSKAIDGWYRNSGDGPDPLNLREDPAAIWRQALDRLTTAALLHRLCELLLANAGVTSIHPAIRAIVDAEPSRGLGRTARADGGHADSDGLVVDRIEDFDANKQAIRAALALYEKNIPRHEQYDSEHMVDLVRRHLSDEFGAAWRLHLIIARVAKRVVGMLLAYEDLGRQFTFISYLAAEKPRRGVHNPMAVSGALVEKLMEDYRPAAKAARTTRFVFEIDHPALAEDAKERRRRMARFELFHGLAPFEKLHLRAVGVRFLQPALAWPPTDAPRELLLCYAAAGLHNSLAKAQAVDLLTWTYTELYAEDIFEDPEQREGYGRHIRQLLADTTATLPDKVPLLRGSALIPA